MPRRTVRTNAEQHDATDASLAARPNRYGNVWVRPWLPRMHRNFFLVYAATLIYHLWCAFDLVVTSPRNFTRAPAYHYFIVVAPLAAWGTAHLVVGAGLYVGLHLRTFTVARAALCAGFLLTVLRWLLLADAWLVIDAPIADALAFLFLIAGLHVAQALEPPLNPANVKS